MSTSDSPPVDAADGKPQNGPPSEETNAKESGSLGLWTRRLAPAAVALVTLTSFSGAVWFAYQQGVQEGLRHTPPLVRAEPGPVKVEPLDPGGLQVPNQDRLVFEALERAVGPPRVEQLLPPPEQPAPLPPEQEESPPAGEPGLTPGDGPDGGVLAPAVAVGAAENEVPMPLRAEVPALVPAAPGPPQPEPPDDPVPAEPPIPLLAAAPAEPDPPPPAGAADPLRVQIGAYGEREDALAGWTVAQRRYGDVLAGLQPWIDETEVAGQGTVYRLQAGPLATEGAAEELCTRLRAAGGVCLVLEP